jgi:hypothetical protein
VQNFFDVVQTRTGDAIYGASVSVHNSGGSLATIYSDDGVTQQTNPMTTNADGEYSFFAADGKYSITITATGYDTQVRSGVVLYDAAVAQPLSATDVSFPTQNDVLAYIDGLWRNSPGWSGVSLLPLNNTWTGTNTFTATVTADQLYASFVKIGGSYWIYGDGSFAGDYMRWEYSSDGVTGGAAFIPSAATAAYNFYIDSTHAVAIEDTGNILLYSGAPTISSAYHVVPKGYADATYAPKGAATASGITMTSARLLGRTTASTGAIEELTVGAGLTLSAGALGRPALTGDVTASADSNATTIANNAVTTAKINDTAVTTAKITDANVTNAKLANMANSTIKGRTTSGTGVPEDMTAAQTAAIVQGDGLTVDLCGFRGVPLNSQSADYGIVAADSGKTIAHPSTDANNRTFTIPANGSVAFPIGTALTFSNMSANSLTIAITTDTMYLAGAGTTGSRTLAQYGVATALKLTSTTWLISGTGLA